MQGERLGKIVEKTGFFPGRPLETVYSEWTLAVP